MDHRESVNKTQFIEKALIGVYQVELREFVPFAYCLFIGRPGGNDLVKLGQRKDPSQLLGLSPVVAFTADSLIESLRSLAVDRGCGNLAEVKTTFIDALMPDVSAFNFELAQPVPVTDLSEYVEPLERDITQQLKLAKGHLHMIRQLPVKAPYWRREVLEPASIVAAK